MLFTVGTELVICSENEVELDFGTPLVIIEVDQDDPVLTYKVRVLDGTMNFNPWIEKDSVALPES